MTRTPLRPLARILQVRAKGGNPDLIERENLRARHETMRDKARVRAEGRLILLGLFFVAVGMMLDLGVIAERPGFVIGFAVLLIMVKTVIIERVNQRLQYMLLPRHFAEDTWTPLAGKNLITHRKHQIDNRNGIIRPYPATG